MKRISSEAQVLGMTASRYKTAMLEQIARAHLSTPEVAFDAVGDCGGSFYLLEEGDDLTAVKLDSDGGRTINLTDLGGVCYEFTELSEDGTVIVAFLATNDAGGPTFFIPNESWVGERFRQSLVAASGRCGEED